MIDKELSITLHEGFYGKLHLSPIAKALPKHPEAA